ARGPEVPALPAAAADGGRGMARPQERPRVLHLFLRRRLGPEALEPLVEGAQRALQHLAVRTARGRLPAPPHVGARQLQAAPARVRPLLARRPGVERGLLLVSHRLALEPSRHPRLRVAAAHAIARPRRGPGSAPAPPTRWPACRAAPSSSSVSARCQGTPARATCSIPPKRATAPSTLWAGWCPR